MATFRSVLSRGIFAIAVLCGSLASMGAAFAPLSPSFPVAPDSARLSSSAELRIVSGPVETKFSSHRDAALGRLEELVRTERALAASA